MKKCFLYIVFIFIIIFSYQMDVLAFSKSYDYNYEVKELTKDRDGNITISGWGIINAGVCDKSNCYCGNDCTKPDDHSPNLKANYGSGSVSGKCTGSDNNKYVYSLYIAPVKENGSSYDLTKKQKIGVKDSNDGFSLTEIMCRLKSSGVCDAPKSACYENVGWSFTFNNSVTTTDTFKNGYIFYLEIYSTGANVTVGFPLIVYTDRIDRSFGNGYLYTNGSSIVNELYLNVVAFNGYYRTCKDGSCQKLNNTQFKNGESLKISGYTTYGQTYFHVEKEGYTSLYIPASWVAPPDKSALIIIPDEKDVNLCSDRATPQAEDNKTRNTCGDTIPFSGHNYADCHVDVYDFYTRKCNEVASVNLSINGSTTENKFNSFNIIDGGGFPATAKIDTRFECTYTFDIDKFKENYDDVLYNLNILDETDVRYAENYVIKEKLDDILTRYKEQTNDLEEWNSTYSFDGVSAILEVGNDSTSLIRDQILQSTLDYNGDNIADDNFCHVDVSKTITLGDREEIINSSIRCGEKWFVSYSLPNVCINVTTAKPETCIPDSNNQLDGGKKYYIDMDSTDGKISLSLTGLGYDGNWSAQLTDCGFNVPRTLKKQLKFRQIDLSDPFLGSYNPNRQIGSNYLNTKYSFVNIIKPNIWDSEYEYQYSMSKSNVNAIRRDTREIGINSYLGKNCYFNDNNDYVCELTRNKFETTTEWFKKADINR